MKHEYIKEEIECAVEKSKCYADIFRNLNIKVNGGSYPWIKKLIKKFGISTNHFWTKEELREKRVKDLKEIKIIDYSLPLPNGLRLKNFKLNKYLQNSGIEEKCNCCGLSSWLGKKITLDIDHINSNCYDNSLENLQYLCPNCHRTKTSEERIKSQKNNLCSCGNKKLTKSNLCLSCHQKEISKLPKKKKINWPNPEQMKQMIWSKPTTKLAKELGVSDVAIGKFCKENNITKPPRGYWKKIAQEGFEPYV